MYESDKVKSLLDKYQNNNTEFKQSVQMCRTLHTQFEDAVTYLKKEVGRIFPDDENPELYLFPPPTEDTFRKNVASFGFQWFSSLIITCLH